MARLNPDQAPARLRRAVEIDPKDWMNWHDRIQNSLSLGDTSGALELSEKTLTIFPGHMILSMDRASALYAGQKYDDCLGILDGLEVLPYEGAWEAHDLYCLTHLKLAMAACGKHSFSKALRHIDLSRDYPETLGTGRPFDPDLRLQDALESAVRRNLGQTAKAIAIDKRISEYTERHVEEGGIGMALAVRILDESAWKERVDRWITGWKARSPQDSILEWILCIMDKNRLGAEEAVRQAGNRSLDLATEAEAVIKSLERRP
jgi:tetratricopeptide (TPR) repeat protein